MSYLDLDIELYRKMYMIYKSELEIIKYYPDDEMRTPMHMSQGQEAISVGVCHALQPEDQVFATYRSHAAFLAKTGDIKAFFAELYGKVSGTAYGKAGSMHLSKPSQGHMLSSAIVASSIPVAVGAAFANKFKRNNLISCVFFGDGALEEGSFWESLNLACVMNLPVLFVCENNGYAVHTPKHIRQSYESINRILNQFGCTNYERTLVDVNDIYKTTLKAIKRIYETGKPSFFHIHCIRNLEHVGINTDFHVGYRAKDESYLSCINSTFRRQREKIIESSESLAYVLDLEKEVNHEILESIELAMRAGFPNTNQLTKGIDRKSTRLNSSHRL